MGRGRPEKLDGAKTTCVILEERHRDYLMRHGLEKSQFYRDYIDSLIKNEVSPREQLIREIAEHRRRSQEEEMLAIQKETMLKEMDEREEDEIIKQNELEEFERKKYEYVLGCKDVKLREGRCTKLWLDHLLGAYHFSSYDEARAYVKKIWIENGVPENRVKKFFEQYVNKHICK